MKANYVIYDDSCLSITFTTSLVNVKSIMSYARYKANCPYFRVMQAKKPYIVYRLVPDGLDVDDEPELYRLLKVGVID